MAERTCSFPGCNRPHYGHGWCWKHYCRWKRHGNPAISLVDRDSSPEQRFLRQVNRGDGTGCWLWLGTIQVSGYGLFKVRGRMHYAHRWAWEHFVGPVPIGLQLDHLCRMRACVKVLADDAGAAHLEPVTALENSLRSQSPAAKNARKTHCSKGHPYDALNTRWYVGPTGKSGRICRTCERERYL